MTVVELPKPTLKDVPRILRAIADEIEAGEYGDTSAGIVVIEESNGNIRTFGAGGADYYVGMALLHLGIENLLAKRGREFML